MSEILTVLIGIFVGFSAGIFGIGGALVATPLLRLIIGLPGVFAVATPLPAAIPAALSGSIVYVRKRMIRFDIAWRTLVAAVPFSQIGVYFTGRSSDTLLMVLTGVVLTYSAITFLERGFRRRPVATSPDPDPAPLADLTEEFDPIELEALAETADPVRPQSSDPPAQYSSPVRPQSSDSPAQYSSAVLFGVGALAGFLSGYLAIGGGIILVPAFVKLLKLPTKDALATSLFCVAGLAIPGTIGHGIAGNIMWSTAFWLSVGVVPLGYVGARVATALRTATLERSYGIVMLAFAVYFTARYLF